MIRFSVQLVIVSQLADLLSSLGGLSLGHIELNPLAQSPQGLVAIKLLAILSVLAALRLASRLRLQPRLVAGAAITVSLFTLGVAWSNLRLLGLS